MYVIQPPGQRIASITVKGKPLEADREYVLVVSEFMAMGGDGMRVCACATLA